MGKLHILYGTETDTALDLAEQLSETLQAAGIESQVVDMQDAQPSELATLSHVIIVTSTFGDGEPPYNARDYHEALHQEGMTSLSGLRYAVLALGDRSYPNFCQCGKDFDARLSALGAVAFIDRHECDGDPSSQYEAWEPKVVAALTQELEQSA